MSGETDWDRVRTCEDGKYMPDMSSVSLIEAVTFL